MVCVRERRENWPTSWINRRPTTNRSHSSLKSSRSVSPSLIILVFTVQVFLILYVMLVFIYGIVVVLKDSCITTHQLAEEEAREAAESHEQEIKELEAKLAERVADEAKLQARLESVTAEGDFTKEQLSALKAKYENIKNGEISGGGGGGGGSALIRPSTKDITGEPYLHQHIFPLQYSTIFQFPCA